MKKVVIDTNVIIDNPEILLSEDFQFHIPYVVLQELDGLKKNPDLSASVRYAQKIIYQMLVDDKLTISNLPTAYETNDEKIVKAAKKLECDLLSGDIGARAVALARHVGVTELGDEAQERDYKGYVLVPGEVSYENYVSYKDMQVAELEDLFDIKIEHNQYVIIDRVNGDYDIWRHETVNEHPTEASAKMVRVSKSVKPYKDAGIMITPLDAYQHCAWDAVFNDTPLTVLEGKIGSSKTLSALVGLLTRLDWHDSKTGQKRYKKYTKIYITRAPIPVDRRLQLGFDKGSIAEKGVQWLAGLTSNLNFIFGQDRAASIQDTYFQFLSLESIQGISLLPTEALIVDEYQLLSKDMLKQVLSRAGEGSKIVLAGDPDGQTYGTNRGTEGFRTLRKHLGTSEYINYVRLDNIYRSKLVEFVDSMF